MTTTQQSFNYVRDGEAYSGAPLYRVETPSGVHIGWVAAGGKRSTVWAAWVPLTTRSVGGFRNREKAAEYLARVAGELS